MLATAADLLTAVTAQHDPESMRRVYTDIQATLARFDFDRVQGSVFLTKTDSLANLAQAMIELKDLAWLPPSVRDIRAFRVENWSDFTSMVKEP